METSSVVKVIAAFLAGLILAMGGGLIYSRSRELMDPVDVVRPVPRAEQAAPVEPQASANNEKEALDQQSPVPAPTVDVAPTIRQSRNTNSPQVLGLRTPIAPEVGQSIDSTPKRYPKIVQLRGSYPVPVLVPPAQAVNQPSRPQPAEPQASQPIPSSLPPPAQNPVLDQPSTVPNAEQITPPRHPNIVTLQSGTNLTIALAETLSTDRNLSGDAFRGTLQSPIVANGFIIADRGSLVLGRIVNLERARMISGSSNITLQLTEINTTDGQLVRISTFPWQKTGTNLKLHDTPKMAFGAAVGAVVGALSGAAKGAGISDGFSGDSGAGNKIGKNPRTVVLPIDTRLTFSLAKPITVSERLNSR